LLRRPGGAALRLVLMVPVPAAPEAKAEAHRGRDIRRGRRVRVTRGRRVITAAVVRRRCWLLVPAIRRSRLVIDDAAREAQAKAAEGRSP
jgi:hypothetical protein